MYGCSAYYSLDNYIDSPIVWSRARVRYNVSYDDNISRVRLVLV